MLMNQIRPITASRKILYNWPLADVACIAVAAPAATPRRPTAPQAQPSFASPGAPIRLNKDETGSNMNPSTEAAVSQVSDPLPPRPCRRDRTQTRRPSRRENVAADSLLAGQRVSAVTA